MENIPDQYSVTVGNKFDFLCRSLNEEMTPNELWEEMKTMVLSSAEETIPKRKRKKRHWISQTTIE